MFNWTAEEIVRESMRCRTFRPAFDGGLASAALFERSNTVASSPVILIQHGGSSSKIGLDVWDVVPELVEKRGFRLIALDGPVHGARVTDGDATDGALIRSRFFDLWKSRPDHVDVHVQRWRSLIDEIQRAMPAAPLMWLGHSMGTAYGIPLLASEKRVCRAAIGMWGTSFANSFRLIPDASGITCPILFQQKWNDELFSRGGQFEIFDAIGTTDKRLHAYPGGHVRMGAEQIQDLARFLAEGVT